MRKIYVVGGSTGYASWMQGQLTDKLSDANLVVFTGGEDIDPDFYGQPHHPFTGSNKTRDRYEFSKFEEAQKLGIPCLGICRGSQFLCVANGGLLVQHQQNPSYVHNITTYDDKELEITSTHHQAAFPYNLSKEDYRILGWTNGISKFHEDGNKNEMHPEKECEIVYYPKTKSLGIQGHPEMMKREHLTITYLQNLLNLFLNNKL